MMLNKCNSVFLCLTFGLLINPATSLFAQQDSVVSRKGLFYVNAGIGYSPSFNGTFPFPEYYNPLLYNISLNEDRQNKISLIGTTVDYMLSDKTSVGLAYSYQEDLAGHAYNDIDNLIRQNIAIRILLHTNKRNKNNIDIYIGLRTGYSWYIDNKIISSSNSYYLGSHQIAVPSFQLLFGLQYYFSKYVGAHFEIGIGSPYLAEAGLSIRLGKHEAKKK